MFFFKFENGDNHWVPDQENTINDTFLQIHVADCAICDKCA